jgi:hypothetical protein
MKTSNDFAVRRASRFTTFSTSAAAMAYNALCLGSMLMIRTTSGWKNFY